MRKKKAKARSMTDAQIEREVQRIVREKVRGVLEEVKKLWVEALSDKDLFGEAKKRRKR